MTEVDVDELGEFTAAAARDYDRAADIAEVTGLAESTVRRKLSQVTHGKKLIRNVFADRWPTGRTDQIDARALERMTSAAALSENRIFDIAQVTGLTEASVRRKLEGVPHGRMLVHNLFWDWWPTGEIDADELGNMTSAAARDADRVANIAEVTGLKENYVWRKLDEVSHGRTLVRNLFSRWWPTGEIDANELGNMTSAMARGENRIADIAAITGLTESTARKKLEGVPHGRTLVRNLFAHWWPTGEIDTDELGNMTSATARDEDWVADIAWTTGLKDAEVRRRLEGVSHGRTLVRNLFSDYWQGAETAREDDDEYGEETAVAASTPPRGKHSARRDAIKIFVSYAREDERYLKELELRLTGINQHNVPISVYIDQNMHAGEKWELVLFGELDHANVVILLISPHFMASTHCSKETNKALERGDRDDAVLIPIIIRSESSWKHSKRLSKYQAITPNVQALAKSDDDAWEEVVVRLRAMLMKEAEKLGVPLRD